MLPDHLLPFTIPTRVLDYGHVALIDVMGDDEAVAEAARVSYQKGVTKRSDTRTLLRYMMSHHHSTPFEACVVKIDMKIPIFVARQLVRHRTQALSELSARYSELPEEFYIPPLDQVCYQSGTNKQGREGSLPSREAAAFNVALDNTARAAFEEYHRALEQGVSRETARLCLPLNTYTQWNTTLSLHNLFHMLGLRMDAHAQWETRQFANAIAEIVKAWVPLCWEAFTDYQLEAVHLSRMERDLLREILRDSFNPDYWTGETLWEDCGLSTRERAEFLAKMGVE